MKGQTAKVAELAHRIEAETHKRSEVDDQGTCGDAIERHRQAVDARFARKQPRRAVRVAKRDLTAVVATFAEANDLIQFRRATAIRQQG